MSGDSKKKIRIYLVKIFVQWVAILSEWLFFFIYPMCFKKYFLDVLLDFHIIVAMFHENIWFKRRILFQKGFSLRKLWQKLSNFLHTFVSICIATSQKHIFHIFTAKCCLSLMQKCNSLSKHGKPVRRKLMYSLYPRPDDYTQWVARFLLLCFFTRKIFQRF